MRAVSGLLRGALYGGFGGLLASSIICSAGGLVLLFQLSRTTPRIGPSMVVSAIGIVVAISAVAAFVGATTGSVAGLVLGILRAERHAPSTAAVLAASPPLGIGLVAALSDAPDGEPLLGVLLVGLLFVAAGAAFGWVGHHVGTRFAKATERSMSAQVDGPQPAAVPPTVTRDGEQHDGPPAGWSSLHYAGQPSLVSLAPETSNSLTSSAKET